MNGSFGADPEESTGSLSGNVLVTTGTTEAFSRVRIDALLADAGTRTWPRTPTGEILREELDSIGLSASALSKALGVPVNRITMILHSQRGVSADTALRLARYFGTTPQLWLNLPKTWKLRRAEIGKGREIVERVRLVFDTAYSRHVVKQ